MYSDDSDCGVLTATRHPAYIVVCACTYLYGPELPETDKKFSIFMSYKGLQGVPRLPSRPRFPRFSVEWADTGEVLVARSDAERKK